jgi:hypothetical protein
MSGAKRWNTKIEKVIFVNMLVDAGEWQEDGKFVVDLSVAEKTVNYRVLRSNGRTIGALKTQINRVQNRLNGVRLGCAEKVAKNFDEELIAAFPARELPEVELVETGITRIHGQNTGCDITVEQIMEGKKVLNNLDSDDQPYVISLFKRFNGFLIKPALTTLEKYIGNISRFVAFTFK